MSLSSNEVKKLRPNELNLMTHADEEHECRMQCIRVEHEMRVNILRMEQKTQELKYMIAEAEAMQRGLEIPQ